MATARIVCEEIGIAADAIREEPLLMEADHGDWEGLTAEQIEAQYPGSTEARKRAHWTHKLPNGESYHDLAVRANQWLASLAKTADLIAVTHEMMSRCVRGQYLRLSPAESLALSHRQDRFFVLSRGNVEEHLTSAAQQS